MAFREAADKSLIWLLSLVFELIIAHPKIGIARDDGKNLGGDDRFIFEDGSGLRTDFEDLGLARLDFTNRDHFLIVSFGKNFDDLYTAVFGFDFVSASVATAKLKGLLGRDRKIGFNLSHGHEADRQYGGQHERTNSLKSNFERGTHNLYFCLNYGCKSPTIASDYDLSPLQSAA